MLVIDDEDVVKVHIHTNNPGFVLEEAVKLGEMINLKIVNMKHQHTSIIEDKLPPRVVKVEVKDSKKSSSKKASEQPLKEYGFASVSCGKGFSAILKDLGVDKIIEGGQTMNPSTDDILKAVKRIKLFLYSPTTKILLGQHNRLMNLFRIKRL